MDDNVNILGCYISGPSIVYGTSEDQIKTASEQGILFRSYIWGEKGISNKLKKLKFVDYGIDMRLILFQFYVKPILASYLTGWGTSSLYTKPTRHSALGEGM